MTRRHLTQRVSALLARFFQPGRGGMTAGELAELGRYARDLLEEIRWPEKLPAPDTIPRDWYERVLRAIGWPMVGNQFLTLEQWNAVLRATDARAGFWDGQVHDDVPPPPPEPFVCHTPEAAIACMAERLGFEVTPNEGPIRHGLYHDDDIGVMDVAGADDIDYQALLGTIRGDLIDAHWSEDDNEPQPDPYPGFGLRADPADERRRGPRLHRPHQGRA